MLQPDEDDDEVIFVAEVIRVRQNAGDRPPPPLLPPCPVIFDLPVRRDVARPVRAPLLITLDDEEDEVVPLENTPAAVDHETDQAEVVEGASTTDQAAAPVDEVSPSTTTISLAHSPLMTSSSGSSQDIPCPWDGTLHTIHLADLTSATIYCSDACIRQHITELETYLAKMNDARMRITSRNADSFTVIHRLEHTLAEQTKSNIFEFLQAHPLYSIVKPIPLKEGLDLLNRSYSSTDSAFLKLPKNVATTNSAVNSLEDDLPAPDDHISMSPGRSSSPVREHKSKRKKKSSLSAKKKKPRDSKKTKKKSKSKTEHLIASPIELPSTSKTSKKKKSNKDKKSRRPSEVETVPAAATAPEPDATAIPCSSKHLVDCAPPGKDWNAKMAGFGGSKKKTKATTEIKTTGGRDVVAKKPTKKFAKSLSTRTALSTNNKTGAVGGSGIKTSKPHPVGQGVVKKSTMPATPKPSTSMINSGAGPSKPDTSKRQPLIGPDGDSLKTPTAATPPSDFFDIDDLFIPLDSLPSMPLPFPERGSLASPSIPPILPPFHPVATSSPKKRPPPAPVDTNTEHCPPPTKRPCLESRTSPQPPRTPMSLKMPPPPQSSASPHQVNDSGSGLNIMGRVDAVRSPFHSAIPSPSSAFTVPGLRTEPVIIPLEAIGGEGTSSAVGRPNSATFDRRLASSIPIHSSNLTLPLPPFYTTLPRKTLTHPPVRGQFPHRSLPNHQNAPQITNKPAKSLSLPISWTSRSPEEQDSPPQQPSSTIASPAATSAATPTEQDISEFLRNARHTGGITIWTGIMVNDIVDSRCQHLRRSFKVLATKLWGDWSQGYFMDANIQKHGGLIISKRVCFEEIFAILDQWQRGNVALMALKQVDGSGGEAYHELHRYLLGRQRMGVVQLTKTTELKHLFVYPLAGSAPVPVPFSEMCFDLPPVNQRPDMFLALMLRLTGPSSSTNTTPRSSFSPLTSPFTPSGASPGNAPSPSLLQPQIRSPGTFSSGSPSPGSGLASFSHGGGSRLHQNANSNTNNRYSRMSPRPTSSSSRQGHPSPRPPNVREEFMNLVLQGEDDVNLPLQRHLPSDQNVAITSTLNQRARRNMAPFSNGEVASGSSASNSSTTVPIGGPRQYRFVPASTSTRYTAGSNPYHGQHRQYRFQPNHHHHHPVAPVQPQQRHDPRDPRLQGRPVSASPPSSSAQPVSAPRRAAH